MPIYEIKGRKQQDAVFQCILFSDFALQKVQRERQHQKMQGSLPWLSFILQHLSKGLTYSAETDWSVPASWRKFVLEMRRQKEVVHSCCFWSGGSPVNRRNDESKRRLKGTWVKDELMDRTKQGGKGKIVVAALPQFFKIFISLVLFMQF